MAQRVTAAPSTARRRGSSESATPCSGCSDTRAIRAWPLLTNDVDLPSFSGREMSKFGMPAIVPANANRTRWESVIREVCVWGGLSCGRR